MRELKLLTKYRHFKNKEYFTLCKSTPVEGDIIANTIGGPCLVCNHTENNNILHIYSLPTGEYVHWNNSCSDELVIYMALYDNFKIYGRPYDMFMSEVDRVKYPNVKQKYRLEEIVEWKL